MTNNATRSRISSPLLLAEHPCLRLGRQRFGLSTISVCLLVVLLHQTASSSLQYHSATTSFATIYPTACSTRPTNDSVDKYACRFTDYKTCHSVCAEPIQCFAPKLSASLEPYLILYKKLTLALKVWWLGKYLYYIGNVHLHIRPIPIALVPFRASLARTMCYVVIHS